MSIRASDLLAIMRVFGARAGWYRVKHELQRRRKRYKPAPTAAWSGLWTPAPKQFPFRIDCEAISSATRMDAAVSRAARVVGGEYQMYRSRWVARPQTSAEWRTNPDTGFPYPHDVPWFSIPHLDAAAGDIKDVWEPARFLFVYDLVRGICVGVPDCAETFWRSLESFVSAAPPYSGALWSCGQETAIRVISLLWGESAFISDPSSTDARRSMFANMLAWSGERIENAVGYAVSQRNNHALSEAVGLMAIGQRLKGAHASADRWTRLGRGLLETLILDQFASDGWYIQHSFVYTRLALSQLVIAQRLLQAEGRSLTDRALQRVRSCVQMLCNVIDPDTGQMPNYGANDGSDVLPIHTAQYEDFRPLLSIACAAFDVPLPVSIPLDAEPLAWLGLSFPQRTPTENAPTVRWGTESGWIFARVEGMRVFGRAGHYRSRPSHIDPLHVDIRTTRGPAAIDAGTFRYSAPQLWANALDVIAVHNTVSPLEGGRWRKLTRFVWRIDSVPRISRAVATQDGVRFTLEHSKWHVSGPTHMREVDITASQVKVTDTVRGGNAPVDVALHWLLPVEGQTPVVTGPGAEELIQADPGSVRGWVSWRYGERSAARSLSRTTTLCTGAEIQWITLFSD